MRPISGVDLFFLFIVGLNSPGLAQSGIITTYVGPGMPVNGGLAIDQAIDAPTSVVPDGAGGFCVTSETQNRVYRVRADGKLCIVAGDGTLGYGGDGGPATSAQLRSPYGIALDEAGNLFIADSGNNRIRKVTAAGIISTIAGNGTPGFSGDGGPATSAQLNTPTGAAIDTAGNLYIAEMGGSRIRKVTPDGEIRTVVELEYWDWRLDDPMHQPDMPAGVAVDAAGNLFIADTFNNYVFKVTPTLGSTVAGRKGPLGFGGDGGPAVAALLCSPYGVAVDAAGNVFIADTGNDRIRKVTADGVISTVAGDGTEGFSGDGGPATSARLRGPKAVAVDAAGSLFIADSGNNRIRRVTAHGIISTVAGSETGGFSGDGGPATSAQLKDPCSVAVDAVGNLFFADYSNNRIRKVTPDGVISTVAGNGSEWWPLGDGGPATSAKLRTPGSVAVDAAGNLFIIESVNSTVRKVTAAGIISTVAGIGPPRGPGVPTFGGERSDFLLATFPIASVNRAAPSPIVFPQIADGGGYVTQFILLSPGGAASTALNFYGETGAPLTIGRQ